MNFLKIKNTGHVDVKDGFIKIIDNTINETPLNNADGGEEIAEETAEETLSYSWQPLGEDIDGEDILDLSGKSVSLSGNGSVVAIGAPRNDGKNGDDSGHVRVYNINSDGSHTQLGQDIDGENAHDGYYNDNNIDNRSVSLNSNGSIVAIGARFNDGNGLYSGHVRVYEYDDSSNKWDPLGQDIDGEAAYVQSGWSVSLSSNGSIVAIGAVGNDGNGYYSGHVRVYQFNGTDKLWERLGQDIDGEATYDHSGWSVSLSSDGSIVAIGAIVNHGVNGDDSGHVRVYKFKGSIWEQLGQDIDGEAEGDQSGYSVSLSSDGSIVAIGARYNDGNGPYSGHVRVYEFKNGTSWVKLGQDIDGEAENDESGRSVSLSSNGSIVAIGAVGNDGENALWSGHVRVYQFNGTDKLWERLGQDIDGEAAYDYSGHSVSLSSDGSIVAIGAFGNYGEHGLWSGHVRVYQLLYAASLPNADVH